jgi:hypothetical protein
MQPKAEGSRPAQQIQEPQKQAFALQNETFDLKDANLSVGDVTFEPEERGFNAPAGGEVPSKVAFASARGVKRSHEMT